MFDTTFAIAISIFPSPSKSDNAISRAPSVAKSTLVAKLPVVILPLVDVFLKTETVFEFELKLVTAISNFPSPSISPIDIPRGGLSPVTKSTFGAILVVEISPPAKVMLNAFGDSAINPFTKTLIGE